MEKITIPYKPDLENLMRLTKYLLWQLPFLRYLPVFFVILYLFTNAPQLLFPEQLKEENRNIDWMPFLVICPLWICLYFYLVYAAKKEIQKNKKNFEAQQITISADSYTQQGETFTIENFWNETYQIKETKSWFLIYPKKNSAFPIIKSSLSEKQYKELNVFFRTLPIRKSLKRQDQ